MLELIAVMLGVIFSAVCGGAIAMVVVSDWIEEKDKRIKNQRHKISRLCAKIDAQCELNDELIKTVSALQYKLEEKMKEAEA